MVQLLLQRKADPASRNKRNESVRTAPLPFFPSSLLSQHPAPLSPLHLCRLGGAACKLRFESKRGQLI